MHDRTNTIERVDEDEIKHAEVFKHPIGIILLYIQATLGMVLAIGLAYFLLPLVLGTTDNAFLIASVFAGVTVVMAALVVLVATIIYRQNRLIITDRNITQILQYGLFNRKVSQLNINNVEDVTAVQHGFLPTIFNYGTLKVETAGEQVNFHYTFCPNVGYYAKIILEARERMLGQAGDDGNGILATQQHTQQSSASVQEDSASSKKTAASTISESPEVNLKDIGAQTIKQAQRSNN